MKTNHILPNTPLFYSPFKLFRLFFHPSYKKYLRDKKSFPLYNRSLISRISELTKVRKKLLLNKAVEFNGKIYFAPTNPGFPSPAYDYMVSKGGLNYFSYATPQKRQIESAFIAITNKCPLNCSHCYEKNNLNKTDHVPEEKLHEVINQLQINGTNIIILTGGEPLVEFDKLVRILQKVNKDLSDFHLHTSGYSLTLEKAIKLKEAGLAAAAVGLDDVNRIREDKIRRDGSYDDAVNALKIFNQAGIVTYVNLCATKTLVEAGDLYNYLELVKSLNVSMIQLLEPRPCGGYLFNNHDEFLSDENKKQLLEFTVRANTSKKYRNYPLVYYVAHIENEKQFGCTMGGLSHFYIDSAGNVNPCVFLPVTFGNIVNEDFYQIYDRMRTNVPKQIHKKCPSLLLEDTILSHAGNGLPVNHNAIKSEWEKLIKD